MMLLGLDTNVLIHAADRSGDAAKHEIAVAVLDRASRLQCGMLALQALTEFYAVAIRKGLASSGSASAYVDVWSDVFPVQPAGLPDVADAIRVHREHGIAFRDAMMWSVLRRAGARAVLSEDFQDGRELEGVRFVNPFNPANAPWLNQALDMTGA